MTVLKRWPKAESIEDLFVSQYARLMGWAQQWVGRDRAAAEDLVQDTFVRVALRHSDTQQIRDVDGYLFVTMRNVHLSQVRRRSSNRTADVVSLADYESIAAGLLAARSQQNRQAAYDELALIARYACLRKATSKAASALILRFFHGYYPSEIARVLHASEPAVDVRLRIARAEARAFIAAPDRLRPIAAHAGFQRPLDATLGDVDFVAILRRSIFDARTEDCLAPADLDRLYDGPSGDPLGAATLAHIVSCVDCLDAINQKLALPLLADRDPSDMLGRGGRRGGPPPGAAGEGTDRRTALRTRLKDVFDDRPKELRIAVNGLFVGSQAVTGGLSEQRVRILVNERIGFIEVFSEHDTCLMYVDVVPPPDGAAEQRSEVDLSDGRRLVMALTFRDSDPLVEVVYRDPTAQPRSAALLDHSPGAARFPDAAEPKAGTGSWWGGLFDPHHRLRWIMTGLVAVAIAGSSWIWNVSWTPQLSAHELLRTAQGVEARQVPPGMASHRVLMLQERVLSPGSLVRQTRVEIWRDDARGIRARRLFDERSQVVAGEWSTPDGLRTVYRAGERPAVGPVVPTGGSLRSGDLWTRDLSASAFVRLIESADRAVLETRGADYLLRYRPAVPPEGGLVEACLTVSRADHRATSETLVLREDGELRQFTLSETQMEEVLAARIPPRAFEPEPWLSSVQLLTLPVPPPRVAASESVVLRPALASAELDRLELDATHRLYRSHLWLGQEGHVTQAPTGVAVTARIADEVDRAGLERGFEELLRNPAVTLTIEMTGADSGASRATSASPISSAPAYPMLQSFFNVPAADNSRDDSLGLFAHSILEAVARRRTRLTALQTLIARWPETRLLRLPLESVVTWQVMVQEHADRVRRDTELLRVQLGAIFKRTPASPRARRDASAALSTVSGAAETAAEIAALAGEQDEAVRAAFLPCPQTGCPSPDVERLMESLVALEAAASKFAQFYLKVGGEPAGNHQGR